MSKEQIALSRAQHIGLSLSISYRQLLEIVRGSLQYLYSEDGRAYLDAANNVSHVGHCHPHVVRAAQEQMAVLNTNTHYLHEKLARYAERLCATLTPAPEQAAYIANRMRDHSILLSTDGPFHNVLKIKPPLVFTQQNADELVNTLDIILDEDLAQP